MGRGVLIDFSSYAQRNGMRYDALGHYAVSLADVKKIAEECNVEFRPGDIFFLRCGEFACHVLYDREMLSVTA